MPTPSTMNEPQVTFLQTVLESIRDGAIQIPRFQRPFVWTEEQMTELLGSVRDGLPIGAIMVWRTHLKDIACRDDIAPGYPVKQAPLAEGALRQYLLDGQQRMATLYRALMPASPDVEQVRRAHLDLESGEFVWLDENPGDFCMPLDIVFDSIRFIKFTRKIPDKQFVHLERVEQVVKAFRDYKIATIPISGEDLAVATLTFQRINSEGTKMSSRHMIHALTWSPTFDLFGHLENLKQEHLAKVGWAEMDDDRILDACAVALGLHASDRDVDALSRRLKNNYPIVEEVIHSIGSAAKFFLDKCFVPLPELVPFQEQLVLIVEAFRQNPSPTDAIQETLRAWFWISTYAELFSGSSKYRKITLATADVRQMAINGHPQWSQDGKFERRNLPPGIDFRTARGKAFTIRLAMHAHEHRLNDNLPTPQDLLSSLGTYAVRRVVAGVEKHNHGSPGNCFVVSQQEQGRLYRELRGQQSAPRTVALCKQHIVSPTAQKLLLNQRHDEFVEQRRRDLDQWERDFMNECKERFQ